MLVQAAATQWQVDPASCLASNGTVSHPPSGRTLAYGDLGDAAGQLPVPPAPPLKNPKDFVLVGTPDTASPLPSAKVNLKSNEGTPARVSRPRWGWYSGGPSPVQPSHRPDYQTICR